MKESTGIFIPVDSFILNHVNNYLNLHTNQILKDVTLSLRSAVGTDVHVNVTPVADSAVA